MPTTTPTADLQSPQIIIDWSEIFSSATTAYDVESMLEWVQSFPQKKSIHVVLGRNSSRFAGRKLQGRLQALGCTVTSRHRASVV